MHQPEIRISYSFLLEPTYRRLFESNPANADKEFPSTESLLLKTKAYVEAWKPLEKKILDGMCAVLDLEFYQNTVDVYIAQSKKSMSAPMIIGTSGNDADRFIDVLTHELIHRLLTDNTQKVPVVKIWEKMFPGLEHLAKVHVLVHATLEHMFRDVLQEPQRLDRDVAVCEAFPAYKKAWEIVNEKGYTNIINEFKDQYR